MTTDNTQDYKAPQQRYSKATIKQHDNTQELDEILANLTTAASDDQFIDDGSIGDAKADILTWHNKQINEAIHGFHGFVMEADIIRPEADQAFNYGRLHKAIDAYIAEREKLNNPDRDVK